MGFIAIILVSFFLLCRLFLRNKKMIALGGVALVAVCILLGIATKGSIFARIPTLLADASVLTTDTSDFDYSTVIPIRDIRQVKGNIEIDAKEESFIIQTENQTPVITDKNNVPLPLVQQDNLLVLTLRSGDFLTFRTQRPKEDPSRAFLLMTLNQRSTFAFEMEQGGRMAWKSITGMTDMKLAHPEVSNYFIGKEKIGSARGYIWGRTLPMLKSCIFLGKGPDTYALDFPQDDFLGKLYAYDDANMFIDKPHNIYMQRIHGNGFIGFLGLAVAMVIYLIQFFKLYALKKSYTSLELMGASCGISIIGYLVAGIFNDPIIGVEPILWILWGAGIAINLLVKKERL